MNSIRSLLPTLQRSSRLINNHSLRVIPALRYSSKPAAASTPAPAAAAPVAESSNTATPPKKGPTPLEKLNETPIQVSSPSGQEKSYDAKITKLVDEISKLTLLEVADLNELLKKRLNIPDTPMMGAMSFAGPGPAAAAEDEEEAAPVKVQTSFTLKMLKFDEGKKVALIKECKNLLDGMNLVQAKKFVESAPCVVKADLPKDEAEKLQKALEAVGATCEVS